MAKSTGVAGLVVGVAVLAGEWSPSVGAAVKPTAVPAAARPAVPPAAGQQPIFVRGTITAVFPSQPNGGGVKGVEVTLFGTPAGGRALPVDTKVTDAAGRFAFMVLPAEKGKRYMVKPRFTQLCCPGCWGFDPVERTFTVQGSETLDFKLQLPSPDLMLSAAGVKTGNSYEGIEYAFQIANKGCLPSVDGSLKLSFAQPCCPMPDALEKTFHIVAPQQSITVTVTTAWNRGGRGCPFTATISAQPFEVRTQDNTLTGTSPNLKLPDFQLRSGGTFIHVANKGTAPGEVRLKWGCHCAMGGTYCPALLPATPGAPTFERSARPQGVEKLVTIGVGGDIAFTIPTWGPGDCTEGWLEALVNSEWVYEQEHRFVLAQFSHGH